MHLPVPQLIVQLVEQHVDISAINLFRLRMSAPIQDNLELSQSELKLINEALALRSTTELPFWDCLLQLTANCPVDTDRLLQIAQRHNPQVIQKLGRDDVKVDVFDVMISNLQPGEVLAMSSRVECPGKNGMHVPMLDFHCKTSSTNDKRVRLIAQSLGLRGYIVHSGQSYHFYGSELFETQELITVLAKALLFAPIVDRAWVAHQLIERACGLRVSPGKTYLQTPVVVDQL
jgi:hypothetical protein